MKKIILCLVVATLFFGEAFATITTPSTQGSEFYFSFMRGRPGRAKTLTLTVSSEKAGKIKFTNANGVLEGTKDINVGITTITLAVISSDGNSKENDANGDVATVISGDLLNCYTIKANSVQNKGYYVQTFETDGTTPLNVSMYAGLSGKQTVDVANLYPIQALGNDYYVMSRSGNTGSNELAKHFPSEALIVATEDHTVIEIYPTCVLDSAVTDEISKIITVTLNKGQTYLLRAKSAIKEEYGRTDLTGTRIVVKDDGGANKCKKIAVFSGTQHGSGELSAYSNGDYEYEQLFPTHLWGTNFIVGSTTTQGNDAVRIVASKPCTDVYINGTKVATLNQSDYYQFIDTESKGCFVNASKPVEVGLFTSGSNSAGAPALIMVAPMEQYLNSITFAATYNSDISEHSVMVTSLRDIYEQTTLNGVALTGWTPIGDSTYYSCIYRGLDTSQPYTLVNNAAPERGGFTAYVFSSQGANSGYGYSAGSAARPIPINVIVQQIPSTKITSANCFSPKVDFEAIFPFAIDHIEWNFGDGSPVETTYINSVSHTYTTKGIFTVEMTVFKTSSECYSSGLSDKVTTNITIKDSKSSKTTLVKCNMAPNNQLASSRTNEFSSTPNYYWSTSTPTDSIKTASISITPAFGSTTTYWVNTYLGCKEYIDTMMVRIPAEVTNTLTKDINGKICGDGSKNITLTANSTGAVSNSFEYNTSNDVVTVPYHKLVSPTSTTSYKLISVGENNCQTIEKTVAIEVNTPFTVALSATPPGVQPGQTITLNAATSPSGMYSYTWSSTPSSSSLTKDNLQPSTATDVPKTPGTITYSVTAVDLDGLCSATSDLPVAIGRLKTVITPYNTNGGSSGKNDIFDPGYDCRIFVFNRIGQQIYEGDNTWDGTNKVTNGKADPGVYFYIIKDKVSGEITIRGSIEVIK